MTTQPVPEDLKTVARLGLAELDGKTAFFRAAHYRPEELELRVSRRQWDELGRPVNLDVTIRTVNT